METAVYLTETDAKLFLDFQKHHKIFETLSTQGAFDVGYGKVIMNFAMNELQNVVIEEVVWRK